MTDRTEYYQRRNTASRKYGRPIVCPTSGHVLDHDVNTDAYICSPCGWAWDHNGEPIELEKTS